MPNIHQLIDIQVKNMFPINCVFLLIKVMQQVKSWTRHVTSRSGHATNHDR